jgi:broad specificity phosphatase PhoE
MKLYLVRHPAVQIDMKLPAEHWSLSDKGRRQAENIAALPWWASLTHLYTSGEGKTIGAGSIIASQWSHLIVESLPGLNEARRPAIWVTDELYRTQVANFFANPQNPSVDDWETAEEVLQRVTATISRLAEGNAAVLSHGLALTLYRGYILGRKATLEDWLLLSMGCWAILERETKTLLQDWTKIDELRRQYKP